MNLHEYLHIQAELQALEQMIASTPEDFVIERMGLESRKEEIERFLAKHPPPKREPARVRLTFRGKPIIGTQGIFADFAAQAVSTFAEAVAAIGASLNVSLGARGIIPDKDKYRMLITGTAVGSFGFQLEEAPSQILPLFNEKSLVESALEHTEQLIKATLNSDDELTEAISDVDPRALERLRKFLETMVSNEAICALSFQDRTFRFADVAQVQRSFERIRKDNIHEEEIKLRGVFEGFIPKHRTFQFKEDGSNEPITGKVDQLIDKPEEINHHLYRDMIVTMIKKTVGTGNPRYHLKEYRSTVC
jgi:hypothetical protein